MAGQILQLHLPAAYGTQTRQSRHIKGNYSSLWCYLGTNAKGLVNNGINLSFGSGSVIPVFQAYKHSTCTGLTTKGHNIKARNTHNALNAIHLLHSTRQLLNNLFSLVQRSTLWQINSYSVVTLVLIRYKGRRNNLVQKTSQTADNDNKHYGNLNMANKPANHTLIFQASYVEGFIKFVEESAQQTFIILLSMRLQNSSTQSRSQSQSHKSGQSHGNSNGQSKLTIQHTHHTTQEGYWYKYCSQYKGNSYYRALYLIHSTLSSIHRIQALFHMSFYILDNYNSIVNYQTDSQYHGKQSQSVDGEA